MRKVSINLVVRDEEKYIPYLLDSLGKQTFNNFELIVVDNNSKDGTMQLLEKGLIENKIDYKIISQKENVGFANGQNIAWKNTQAEYVLSINTDTYLLPETLFQMVAFMDNHHNTASLAPRLMQWDFDKLSENKSIAVSFSKNIDALGISLYHNRRAIEMYCGLKWQGDSKNKKLGELFSKKSFEVFGISGALALYRKSLLDQVCLPENNLFDPTYHSYKEDLDLAYRLRNAGYLSFVLLEAVAYHDRTSSSPITLSDISAIKNKQHQSDYVRYHSYKNHLATLYKNEYWQNLLLDAPFILWFELRKAGYIILTAPKIFFKSWWSLFKNRKYLYRARQSILKNRKMFWKGIRRWF